MNEFQRQYIECSKRYREKEDADSVRALYALKESLEAESAPEAKRVLVDVYDLLDFKKSAYELFSALASKSDRKDLKRLGSLKEYAENWGDTFAVKCPKTAAKIKEESKREEELQGKQSGRAKRRRISRFSATTRIRWRPVCFKR